VITFYRVNYLVLIIYSIFTDSKAIWWAVAPPLDFPGGDRKRLWQPAAILDSDSETCIVFFVL